VLIPSIRPHKIIVCNLTNPLPVVSSMTKQELRDCILTKMIVEMACSGVQEIPEEDLLAMAYNKALEDALDKSYLSYQCDLEGHLIRVVDEADIERLRIPFKTDSVDL
jgi:hypothetical protein